MGRKSIARAWLVRALLFLCAITALPFAAPVQAQDVLEIERTYHWRSITGPARVQPAPVLGWDPVDGSGLYFESVDNFPIHSSGTTCWDIVKAQADFVDPVVGPFNNFFSSWRIRYTTGGPCSATYTDMVVKSTTGSNYNAHIRITITNTPFSVVQTNFAAPAGQTTTVAPTMVVSDPDSDPLAFSANGAATGAGCGTVSVAAAGVSITPSAAGGTCSVPVRVTDSLETVATTLTFTTPEAQSIAFTSAAPIGARAGGPTYTPTATATSGLPVNFSLDAGSTGCTLAGGTVSFTGAGTCRINANQPGDASFQPAPEVQQAFAVAAADPPGMAGLVTSHTYHWRDVLAERVLPPTPLGTDENGSGFFFTNRGPFPAPEGGSKNCFDIEKRIVSFEDPTVGTVNGEASTWGIRYISGEAVCAATFLEDYKSASDVDIRSALFTFAITNTAPKFIATSFNAAAGQTTSIPLASIVTDANTDPLALALATVPTGPGCGTIVPTATGLDVTPSAAGGTCTVRVQAQEIDGPPGVFADLTFTTPPALPTVTALNPAGGPLAGGTSVVITGTFLTGATAVTFGGADAAGFTVDSATQITATAPAGTAPGTVDVQVTTPAGTSDTAGTGDDYTYAAPPSSNADLEGLTLSQGTLTPTFDSGVTGYTANVANGVTSLTLTPTAADAGASIMVNGTAVISGSASGPIALAVGANTITTVVTAADGTTTRTYTVTVTRAAPPSSNADLEGLALSQGTLSPAFASGVTTYTANVANSVTALTLTPTTADAGATVTVNGVAVTSGSASGAIALAVGANTLTTVVTAADGTTTRTYTVTVTRAAPPSTNADLSGLTLSQGTLTPTFASAVTAYTATVANSVTALTLTPTTADAGATVTVNGTAVTSGTASGSIALAVGANTITTVVTAADGTTTRTYTVTVTRAAPPSSDADLSGLTLSQGTLTPTFDSGVTGYTANVANSVTSLTLTPTTADAGATVTVNGVNVTSGTASGAIALAVGANTLTTVVTAADGTTTRTYTVTVTRAAPPSSNADLSGLTLSQGTLTPTFASNTTSYTASVATTVTSLTLTPTAADAGASITVNGTAVTSGSASDAIALAVGANTITTVVTAADGTTTRTYTVTVTREAPPSSNADLAGLALSQGTLTPTFASDTTSYTANVANSVTSLTLTPTAADAGATVTVNGVNVTSGTASGAIALAVGANTITTVVTAADGTTTRTYTVTVTRAAPPSSNAELQGLTLSQGTLTPTFDSGVTGYTASVATTVTSLTLTPTTADAGASITVNGVSVTSGSASGAIALSVGANTLTTVVTAADGTTTRTYTVTVARAAPLAITLAAAPEQRFGVMFVQENRAVGGSGAGFLFAVASGALPAGTALDAGTGTVSGVAAAAGAYRYTISVTDSAGNVAISAPIEGTIAKASQTLTFAPLADVPLTTGTVGLSVSASSGLAVGITILTPAVCTLADQAIGLLAPGLCTIAAEQPGGPNHEPAEPVVRSFNVTAPALTWTTRELAPATVGIAYAQQLAASGGSGALGYAVTSGPLPAGLSLDANGALTGTPTAGGAFDVIVTVSDGAEATATQTFTLTVAAPIVTIRPDALADGQVGAAYSQALTASGGTGPHAFALASGVLPPGLSLSPAGVVAGTPTQSGRFAFRIAATDASGGTGPFTGSRDYTIVIGDVPPLAAAPALTVPYDAPATPVPVALSGGPATSLAITTPPANGTVTVSGTMISYQPRSGFAGNDSFAFTATGPGGTSAPAAVAVTVLAPEIAITQSSLPDIVSGEPYSQTLTATGGAAPYRFAITAGSLPAGLALSEAGVISGTPQPAAVGQASFTITATDASSGTGPFRASRNLTLMIRLPAAPVVRDAPPATVVSSTGERQGETRIELGGLVSGPFTDIQLATLPANGTATLVRGADQGAAVVYRPNRGFTGTERFQFVAVGPGGTSAPAAITINVIGTRPTAAALEASTIQAQPVTLDLTAAALEGPFTGAALIAVTPAGEATATLQEGGQPGDRTYRLTVTPNGRFAGLIRVTYTLANAWGVSEPAVVTVTVAARPDPSSNPIVQGLSDAQAEQARRFGQTQLGNFERRLERLHGTVPRRSNDIGLTGGGAGAALGGSNMDSLARFGGMASTSHGVGMASGAGPGLGRELSEAQAGFADVREDAQAAAAAVDPDAVRQVGQAAMWAGGSLMVGTLDQTTLRSELSVRTQGLSVGIDYKFSDTVTAGFGLGLGWDSTDVAGGLGSADATNRVGALYGSIKLGEGVFLDMVGGYGTIDLDTTRVVGIDGSIARAAREGDMLFGSASFALDRIDGGIRWSTYAQVQALHAHLGAYTESGAGIWNLTYAARGVDSLVGVIGGRANTTLRTALGLFSPSLRLDWRHEFLGQSVQRLDYADLIGAGPPQFALAATRFARNEINVELGGELMLSPDWALAVELGARHSAIGTLGTGRFTLRWRF